MTDHLDPMQFERPRNQKTAIALPFFAATGTTATALRRSQPRRLTVPLSTPPPDRGRLASHDYRAILFPGLIESREVAILTQRKEAAEIEWRAWRFGDQS